MSATLVTPSDSATVAAKLTVCAAGTKRSIPSTLFIWGRTRRWRCCMRSVTAGVRGGKGRTDKICYILDCRIRSKGCPGLLKCQYGTRDHSLLLRVQRGVEGLEFGHQVCMFFVRKVHLFEHLMAGHR